MFSLIEQNFLKKFLASQRNHFLHQLLNNTKNKKKGEFMQLNFDTTGMSKLTKSHNRLISAVQGSQTVAAKISSLLADRMNVLYKSKKEQMDLFTNGGTKDGQTIIGLKDLKDNDIGIRQSEIRKYEAQISVVEGNFSQSVEQMQNNTQSITSYVQDLLGIVKVTIQAFSTMASQLAKQI